MRDGCFTMLTTAPGPDVAPFHDRQIITLAPMEGLGWLSAFAPLGEMLRVPQSGLLRVRTLRENGVVLV